MMLRVIGITGGIGAGKSVVSRVLRSKGFEVYDCDLEARKIMDCSEDLRNEIALRLGPQCLSDDGSLNRPEIARLVFGDDDHRLWLNSRVHRLVREDLDRRIDDARRTTARLTADTRPTGDDLPEYTSDRPVKLFFIESAIMNSSGLTQRCDEIWLVTAPQDVRIARVIGRDAADEAMVKSRMAAQADEFAEFPGVPVRQICNDGRTRLLPVIQTLINRARSSEQNP